MINQNRCIKSDISLVNINGYQLILFSEWSTFKQVKQVRLP